MESYGRLQSGAILLGGELPSQPSRKPWGLQCDQFHQHNFVLFNFLFSYGLSTFGVLGGGNLSLVFKTRNKTAKKHQTMRRKSESARGSSCIISFSRINQYLFIFSCQWQCEQKSCVCVCVYKEFPTYCPLDTRQHPAEDDWYNPSCEREGLSSWRLAS